MLDLESLGVVAEYAAALAEQVGDLSGTPEQQCLQVALVAAADTRRFGAVLGGLLDRAATGMSTFGCMDAGRWWHLRGLCSFRVDHDSHAAMRALTRSLAELDRDSGPEPRAYSARVYDTCGQVLAQLGQLRDARREFELALARRSETDDELGRAITLGNLGRLCLQLGDYASARSLLVEDLRIVERLAPERRALRGQLVHHSALCAIELGDLLAAELALDRAADLGRDDPFGICFVEIGRGRLALARHDPPSARRHLALARGLFASALSDPSLHGSAHRLEGDVLHAEGQYDAAVAAYGAACRAFDAAHEPVDLAAALRGLGTVHLDRGTTQEAVDCWRQALCLLDATAADAERSEVERLLQTHARDTWLLHVAGRFVGQKQIAFAVQEAGHPGFRGERKDVVTLFSDIRGFTGLGERLEPTALIELLNDLLTRLTRCIESHGGAVDKYIGDAVMAVFSLPDPDSARDAEQAILAALLMSDEIGRFNRQQSFGSDPLRVGVGIHCGEVVAGLIGSPQKRSYTVIGDSVNLASRLEGMTKQLGASILVTDQVLMRLPHRDRFVLRPLGRYAPKGHRSSIEVWDVMGERTDHVPSPVLEEVDAIEAALRELGARDFAAAERHVLELAARFPDRAPGYVRIARACRAFLEVPPPDDWIGQIDLTEK